MKLTKVLSLVLVVVMLASMLIACGDDTETTTPVETTPAATTPAETTPAATTPAETTPADTTPAETTPAETTPAETTPAETTPAETTPADTTPADTTPAETLPVITWGDKTVDVLGNGWWSSSGSWTPVEFWVAEYGENTVENAVLDRTNYLNENFGVTFNFILQTSPKIDNIASSVEAGTKDYDLWMPKILDIQSIVANKLVFDLSDSEYIDFSKSYYNQISRNAFTIADHTFFATGDFNYITYEVTYLWFVNAALGENVDGFPEDLYQLVRDGEWTLDLAFDLARQIGGDANGDGIMDLNDNYGLVTGSPSAWPSMMGVNTVEAVDGEYTLGVNNSTRATKILGYILQMVNSDWYTQTAWTDSESVFKDGRCLFYQEVVQKFSGYFGNDPDTVILPNPKLDKNDTVYGTTGAYSQAQTICIPKCTEDRAMSEYFFELLFQTGSEMIMPEYLDSKLIDANPDIYEDSVDMLVNYIFPGATIDVGTQTKGWSGYPWENILSNSISNKTNTFAADYAANAEAAQEILDEWNTIWADYSED